MGSAAARRSPHPTRPAKGLSYAEAGVDVAAGDRLVRLIERMMRRTHGPRVIGEHGAFAGMFRLDYNEKLFRRNYRDPVLVACTDGVGTKVKLAAEMGVYDTVGIDCVAMNVNDLIVQGAEPLFFLDYLGLHRQDPERTAEIVRGVARGCEIADCALIGGECAEMPDIYAEGDFDIAGFAVGVVELRRAIDPMRVEKGDAVIGLASDGVHSNGFTLVRRIIEHAGLDLGRPWSELAPAGAADPPRRPGPAKAPDAPDADRPLTLGDVLLTPTRIYARPIVRLLRQYKVKRIVSGMAHITGGGLPGNVRRVLPDSLDARISRRNWPVPPVFPFLRDHGDVDEAEMLRVFNMGVGLVLIVRPAFANSVVQQLRRGGESAFVLGEIVRGSGTVKVVR